MEKNRALAENRQPHSHFVMALNMIFANFAEPFCCDFSVDQRAYKFHCVGKSVLKK